MAREAEEDKIIFMTKDNLNKKASFTFYQILGVGIGFLVLLLLLSIKLYPKLFLLWQSFLGKLESICGCSNHLSFANHSFFYTSLISLGLVLTAFIGFAIFKIIKSKRSTKKFVAIALKNKRAGLSRRLKKTAQAIGLENQIIEINNKKPIIFCFGLIKPKICVSSGFTKGLSKYELKAALLHEQHHLLVCEPIKLFIVKLIASILFFLPGLKAFIKQYFTFSELAADQWATNNFKDKAYLVGALRKAIRWKKQMMLKDELALAFFASSVIEERVNKLIDNGYKPRFKFFNLRLSIGILLLVSSFTMASGLLVPNVAMMADHEVAYCSAMESDISQQCEVSLASPICNMEYPSEVSACTYQD